MPLVNRTAPHPLVRLRRNAHWPAPKRDKLQEDLALAELEQQDAGIDEKDVVNEGP